MWKLVKVFIVKNALTFKMSTPGKMSSATKRQVKYDNWTFKFISHNQLDNAMEKANNSSNLQYKKILKTKHVFLDEETDCYAF